MEAGRIAQGTGGIGDLDLWEPWTVVPTGTTELTAEIAANGSQEFFPLGPAVVPGKVIGLVATPLNTVLSLHWERDALATHYTLYMGDGPVELVAVPHVGPMVLTVEKPGYVPWSWRFDGRPTEKEYGMIPVTWQASRIPAPGESPVNAGLFRLWLLLPPGSFTTDGVAHASPVTIEHAVILLGNGFVHPFPPNPRMDIAGNLEAISLSDYLWLDVRTPVGGRSIRSRGIRISGPRSCHSISNRSRITRRSGDLTRRGWLRARRLQWGVPGFQKPVARCGKVGMDVGSSVGIRTGIP